MAQSTTTPNQEQLASQEQPLPKIQICQKPPHKSPPTKPHHHWPTKPRETHEIQPHHQSRIPLPCFYLDQSRRALEFDEGGASGAWIDDEAWIGGEMED